MVMNRKYCDLTGFIEPLGIAIKVLHCTAWYVKSLLPNFLPFHLTNHAHFSFSGKFWSYSFGAKIQTYYVTEMKHCMHYKMRKSEPTTTLVCMFCM